MQKLILAFSHDSLSDAATRKILMSGKTQYPLLPKADGSQTYFSLAKHKTDEITSESYFKRYTHLNTRNGIGRRRQAGSATGEPL
jgi:hypothetical protein